MRTNRLSVFLLYTAATALLAGCQSTASPSDSQVRTSKIDSVLERAAANAASRGESAESLLILEKMYKRNSSDPEAALRYAHALREGGYVNRAAMVLGPFANDSGSPAAIKTEYAATQLELGRYGDAEEYAQQAVLQNPEDSQAFHYLGIALDAQGMHKEAERAFRKGLDHWQGDPAPIMNNLALNLASQGFVDEAVEILQKAQAISPNRVEIERNLRIVTTLQESGVRHNTPKPAKKPDMAAAAPPIKVKDDVVTIEAASGSEENKTESYGPIPKTQSGGNFNN